MLHFTRIHMRGAVLLFMGLCIETNAFVPLLLPATARRMPCRAPPLRVAMQFQSASSARRRELDFKMPKSKPLPAKREPEGLLEDDPSLPVVEDIIRALDERKVRAGRARLRTRREKKGACEERSRAGARHDVYPASLPSGWR
jgi:hypothetical protein